MPTDDNDHSAPFLRQQMGEIAFSAAIGAALMLFVGFFLNLRGFSASDFYNLSVDGFTWLMKIGGVLMGVVAVLLWVGLRPVLLVDAVLTLVLGALMIVVGGIWLGFRDVTGILQLIFGVVFIRSGWGSWVAFRGSGAGFAMPLAASQDDGSPSPVTTIDPAARQEAMDRLMASKKREAPVEPVPVIAKPVPQSLRPPDKVPPLARNEPPPEGFLAELGREDEKKEL